MRASARLRAVRQRRTSALLALPEREVFLCSTAQRFSLGNFSTNAQQGRFLSSALLSLYLCGFPFDTGRIGPTNGFCSLPQLPFVVVIYRSLDGENLVLQIPVTDLSTRFIFRWLNLNQLFIPKFVYVFPHSVFAHPNGSADSLIAGPARVRLPIFAVHEITVDCNFTSRQPDMEDNIGQRKKVCRPLCLCRSQIAYSAPPPVWLSIHERNFSLGTNKREPIFSTGKLS